MGKTMLIARREFNERVKKKSFIITTVLMPVFMVAIFATVFYMMSRTSDKLREITVIDNSGLVGQNLQDEGVLRFQLTDETLEQVREGAGDNLFGILVIGADVVSNPRNIQFYTYEASTMAIESAISSQIKKIIEDEKLKAYDIDDLAQIMQDIETKVTIQTKEITSSGEARDSSSTLSMIIAYAFGFLIYMFVLMYGMMVMQGVIEEKSNKVMELMVSSVRPFQLMMGKIIGIASVALTQLLIWVVFIGVAGSAIATFFMGDTIEMARTMSEGAVMGMSVDPAAMGIDMDTAAMINRITDVKYLLTLGLGFLLYFIGGYLLYAAMFAAVGSAVDNEKDTSNLQLPITIPLILGLVVMINAMNDPHSTIAFWFSLIPFTSPVVMMARLPYGVPFWELGLSIALLYGTFIGVVWLAGKIYRVGIFMYGKKPTFGELWKWSKYKY